MNIDDKELLGEARRTLLAMQAPTYEDVSRLLLIRDRLSFKDGNWYLEFDSHIATVDSCAASRSENVDGGQYAVNVFLAARQRLIHLVTEKLAEVS